MVMLNNFETAMKESTIDYPISDGNLPFSQYLQTSRAIIKERRPDLQQGGSVCSLILNANSPYELYPPQPIYSGQKIKYGVLLIHGLLDCPFSLRDIAARLQANGILCKSILLPGHGTQPADLLDISYQEWIHATDYGIANLSQEVEQLFIAGYSTGAALAAYQALQKESPIAGIILLAPAIRIKPLIGFLTDWHYFKKRLHWTSNEWINQTEEIDYTKYRSVPFNAVKQVALLTDQIHQLQSQRLIACPIWMGISYEDETVCSRSAIDFFATYTHPRSQLLLYTSVDHTFADPRVNLRITYYPSLHIQHLSHIGFTYEPTNTHYGQHGDYECASHIDNTHIQYGAYNHVTADLSKLLYEAKLQQNKYQTLTYNPDFNFMVNRIIQFVLSAA
jgi:esterase/lipase